MSLLLWYLGMVLLTSIVSLFFFEKLEGDCTSYTDVSLLLGIMWPLSLPVWLLVGIYFIFNLILKMCIYYIKDKEA